MTSPITLPPLPDTPSHPEPQAWKWTALELSAIRAYGQKCMRVAIESDRLMRPPVAGMGPMWQLVPKEPTPRMIAEMGKVRCIADTLAEAYRAALAAAPEFGE